MTMAGMTSGRSVTNSISGRSRRVIELNAARSESFLKLKPAVLGEKIFVGLGRDAEFVGEHIRPVARQQNVLGAFHHEPCEADRIAEILDERHGAGLQRMAVHDRRIHFLLAFVREDRAAAGVEKREILERHHDRFDDIESRRTALEQCAALGQCRADAVAVFTLQFRRHLRPQYRPGSAVHCKCELIHNEILPHLPEPHISEPQGVDDHRDRTE